MTTPKSDNKSRSKERPALKKIVEGIHKFNKEIYGKDKQFYIDLAKGQAPECLFITCADSRINPNLITQTKPGELFILRNAGNIVPPWGAVKGGEAATIEYAIYALNVKDVVICGHSQCGAMKAILHPPARSDLPAVCDFLEHAETTRRIIFENYKDLVKENEFSQELLNATVQENVLVQLESLRTHPMVATRLARGELRLHAWFYKIETGEIFYYDGAEGKYRPLADIKGELSPAHKGAEARRRAS
jgi:carbonic anhydrase